jgi:hypothetical protein
MANTDEESQKNTPTRDKGTKEGVSAANTDEGAGVKAHTF